MENVYYPVNIYEIQVTGICIYGEMMNRQRARNSKSYRYQIIHPVAQGLCDGQSKECCNCLYQDSPINSPDADVCQIHIHMIFVLGINGLIVNSGICFLIGSRSWTWLFPNKFSDANLSRDRSHLLLVFPNEYSFLLLSIVSRS